MPKICRQCSIHFEITDADRKFYAKVAVPEPSLCPECRVQRRTAHRNEQCYYKNISALSGKPLISIYSTESGVKVFSQTEWNSDLWDPMSFGRDFDFNKPFFEQFHALSKDIPRANSVVVSSENCEYTTGTGFCKNCYLINSSEYCEDCMYSKLLQTCKNVLDSSYCYDSELLYECFSVSNCYHCTYLSFSQNCSDCHYSETLRGCQNCFLSSGLVNKKYVFKNQQYSQVEYEQKVKEYLASQNAQEQAKQELEILRTTRVHKYANIVNCENSTGDFLMNSRNCTDSYDCSDCEDCRFVQVGVKAKDLMDCSNMYINPELSYEVLGTIGTHNVHFCLFVFHSNDLFYSEQCFSSKNLFGCVGLKHKQYCILNKQYTQAEYEALMPKIIEYMKKTGEWGEFFPASLSPFAYNETVAYEYFPLSKEQVLAHGWKWQDANDSIPHATKIINDPSRLPDRIEDIPNDILQWAIQCKVSGRPFKIQKMELDFYRKMKLPIPHCHPDVRYKNRMNLRNPRKLWQRNCTECHVPIETTYSPERHEKVLCEACYLKIVS